MTFGQKADPCVGIFAKVMTVFEPKLGNHNVALLANVPGLPDEDEEVDEKANGVKGPLGHRVNTSNLYVATDYSGIRRIDPSTLQPLGEATQSHLHPSLSGPCSCAHAQRDPVSGDLFNFNLAFGRVPTYRIFRVANKTFKPPVYNEQAGINAFELLGREPDQMSISPASSNSTACSP